MRPNIANPRDPVRFMRQRYANQDYSRARNPMKKDQFAEIFVGGDDNPLLLGGHS